MRIVIAGKNYIACEALRYVHDFLKINKFNYELIAVPLTSDDGEDTWQPSLLKVASRMGVKRYNAIDEINLCENDILISLEYDKIIKEKHLNNAKAFNIHFSNLPKYRGCLTSVWPIRNGEPRTGVTLHVITPGIDDGPIVDQFIFEIPEYYTAYDLYLAYNYNAFILLKRNLQGILIGKYNIVEQCHEIATYYKRNSIDFTTLEVTNFNRGCIEVYNYVRSLIFPPYQLPSFQGKKIASCHYMYQNSHENRPGEIIEDDVTSSLVACNDGYIRFKYMLE